MTPQWIEPVTLDGHLVRLEPLGRPHLDDLAAVGLDPAIWRWMPVRPSDRDDLARWLEAALATAESGSELPFATIDRRTGRAVGSTRYLNLVPEHRRLEIGWTWLAPTWQRTGMNREAKLLLLEHAFESLAVNRVEFKTDSRNAASRAALVGIGATFEGVLRDHMVMPDEPLRHSAYYSVVAREWPRVGDRLRARISP